MVHRATVLDPSPSLENVRMGRSHSIFICIYSAHVGDFLLVVLLTIMILRFPHGQTSHIAIETDPFVLRMCVFNLPRLHIRRLEFNLKKTLLVLGQLFCNIDTMHDPHIAAFQYNVIIELDSGISIQAIECQYMTSTRLSLRNGR